MYLIQECNLRRERERERERLGYLRLVRYCFFFIFFFLISMGGIRSFFTELKLFQLVVEEGGNCFVLRIFERGKYFMKSVFMSKSTALSLMKNIEHTVVGCERPRPRPVLWDVGPNPREWVESCYCLSKWRFD